MKSHGKHIKLLGRGDAGRLSNVAWIEMFLRKVVAAVGMRPLGDAMIRDVKLEVEKLGVDPFEDEGGISGVIILSTSHVSIHTWPLRNYFVFDLYSCRNFDEQIVKEIVRMYFMAVGLVMHDLSVSLEYPA